MTPRTPVVLTLSLVLGAVLLSGCASMDQLGETVKSKVMLPKKAIAAPKGELSLFHLPEEDGRVGLSKATRLAVASLFAGMSEPLMPGAPVAVATFTSMNPEIINTNKFGVSYANSLREMGKEAGFEDTGRAPFKITGTYTRVGEVLTIDMYLVDTKTKAVLADEKFDVPIDGALREQLDK